MMESGLISQRHPVLTSYLDKWAQDSPGKIALIQGEEGKQWMYRQLAQQVEHLTEQFWRIGLRPGDRLISFMPNGPENVAIMWACWKLGAAFVPLSKQHIANNPQHILDLIQAKLIITDTQSAKILHQGDIWFDESPYEFREWQANKKKIIGLPGLKHIGGYQFSFRKSLFQRRKPWEDISNEMHTWRPALICYPYTPEGTAPPMLMCFEQVHAQISALSELTSLGKSLKTLAYPPIQQPESLIYGIIMPLVLGGTSVLTNATSIQEWKSLVNRYHVNTIFPRSIALENVFDKGNLSKDWASLSHIFFPYPKSDAAAGSTLFCKMVGGITLREAGGYLALQHPRHPELYVPMTRISIREPLHPGGKDGREVNTGEIGEICLHPPLVHGGLIFPDSIESPDTSRNGIFYTGIQGRLYELDGQMFLKAEEKKLVDVELSMSSAA